MKDYFWDSSPPSLNLDDTPPERGHHGPGYIYLMVNTSKAGGPKKCPRDIIKIGLTNNLARRLEEARSHRKNPTYQLSKYNMNPSNYKYKFTFKVKDRKDAENMMFDILRAYRLEREFYIHVPDNALKHAIQRTKHEYGV